MDGMEVQQNEAASGAEGSGRRWREEGKRVARGEAKDG